LITIKLCKYSLRLARQTYNFAPQANSSGNFMPVDKKILSVTQLNQQAKSLLELHLNPVWVEGEISNFSAPGSGHWYFSLKDSRAQIRCAMFRNRNMLVSGAPKPGDQVALRGRVSLYEARGEYQMIVEHLEPAGRGVLLKAFEDMKNRLHQEGLFDQSHKHPLPKYVDTIALVTSPIGAAVHDILTVLKRRNPAIKVIVVPSSVQGDMAPAQLVHALNEASDLPEIDAIIIGRGGGSMEDLWAFNDEGLARAIYHCPVPVISAVGHEVDVSISDFVADVRAPTPSAAAELIAVEQTELIAALDFCGERMVNAMNDQLSRRQTELEHKQARLKHPDEKIEQWKQRLDLCELQMTRSIQNLIKERQQTASYIGKSLMDHSPKQSVHAEKGRVQHLSLRLANAVRNQLHSTRQNLAAQVTALDIVSPLATLNRGYSITKDSTGKILRSATDTKPGDKLSTVLAEGRIESQVIKINKHSN
jgi:exodeoxyribonuclease VII large subunit